MIRKNIIYILAIIGIVIIVIILLMTTSTRKDDLATVENRVIISSKEQQLWTSENNPLINLTKDQLLLKQKQLKTSNPVKILTPQEIEAKKKALSGS